jgi:hypothetical protein
MADGMGCRCAAHDQSECGCPDVDWTPQEVYDLRAEVKKLKAKLDDNLSEATRGPHPFCYDCMLVEENDGLKAIVREVAGSQPRLLRHPSEVAISMSEDLWDRVTEAAK